MLSFNLNYLHCTSEILELHFGNIDKALSYLSSYRWSSLICSLYDSTIYVYSLCVSENCCGLFINLPTWLFSNKILVQEHRLLFQHALQEEKGCTFYYLRIPVDDRQVSELAK